MKKRGFTLIEMLIVIVIIGILAGALIPRIGTARDKANDTAREANVRSLATAMVQYGLDHGNYPVGVYNGNEWLLANYGVSQTFDWQPTDNDYYDYRQLDGGSHFVFFTTLSEGSEAGNCDVEMKCMKGNEEQSVSLKDCKGDGTTIKITVTAYVNDEIDEHFDDTKYSEWNTKVIKTSGSAFCYLQ